MPRVAFDALPLDGRLWVFGAERALDADEEALVLAEVDQFLEGWKAHGVPLRGARTMREGRFLMVGVDASGVPPSGCSIDAMVRSLRELEARLGVGLADHGPVYYRANSGEVRRVGRGEFRRLAEAGEVGPHTRVLDTTLTHIGSLEEGWERPARETWHARLLPTERIEAPKP